jgi:hypothetical protein
MQTSLEEGGEVGETDVTHALMLDVNSDLTTG